MNVIVLIQRDIENDVYKEPQKPTIIVCADENSFEKKVKEHLEEYFDENDYNDCGMSKEEFANTIINELKTYNEMIDPLNPVTEFIKEYHKIF